MRRFILLPLLAVSLCLCFSSRLWGVVSLIQKSASADKAGAAMVYTVTATTAGNLLVVMMNFRDNAADTVTSITDASGDTFATSNARSTSAGDARSIEIWHCLNISAGIVAITINQSGVGTVTITTFEYHSSLGLFLYDTGGGTTNAFPNPGTECLGAVLNTTGASDVLVAYWGSINLAYVSVVAPFVYEQNDGHDNRLFDAINQAAGAYQIDVTAAAAGWQYNLSTAAYKEPGGGGTAGIRRIFKTYSKSLYQTIAGGGGATIYFSDGFEGASIVPPWDYIWTVGNPSLNANPAYVHAGSQSLQIYYVLPGGSGHIDSNRYVTKYFDATTGYPNGLDHFFIRGYIYLKTPEPGGEKDIQRKLYYLMSPANPPGHPVYQWAALVDTFTTAGSGHKPELYFTMVDDVPANPAFQFDTGISMNWDQWYSLEFEIQANTPGASDGEARIWLDGALIYTKVDCYFRSAGYTEGIIKMQVGDQADTVDLAVDEYRYWDDVAVSSSYIGP